MATTYDHITGDKCGRNMAPKWLQDGLKIAQDGPAVKPRALDVLSVMERSRPDTSKCNVDVIAWAKGGECQ